MLLTWTHTSRGRALDLLDPQFDDVDLDEISTALGNQCRYNGCIRRFYSVAEHCVLVSRALEARGFPLPVVLGGLLHDGAEAYTGDITWPVQAVLFLALDNESRAVRARYKAMQTRLDALIVAHVNARAGREVVSVVDLHCDPVKTADLQILLDERKALLTEPPPRPWRNGGKPLGVDIIGLDPPRARGAWIERLDALVWRSLGPGVDPGP